MGTEAEQIYKSLSFKKEDKKNFDIILSKFDAYFMLQKKKKKKKKKKNMIHEHAESYLRTQIDGQLIEKFVRGLYELAENGFPLRKMTRQETV